jgi:hypothetical protein
VSLGPTKVPARWESRHFGENLCGGVYCIIGYRG